MIDPPAHKPTIDHIAPGIFTHDQACAVCHTRHAVLQGNDFVFLPCPKCQDTWELRRRSWLGRLYEKVFGKQGPFCWPQQNGRRASSQLTCKCDAGRAWLAENRGQR